MRLPPSCNPFQPRFLRRFVPVMIALAASAGGGYTQPAERQFEFEVRSLFFRGMDTCAGCHD